MANHIEFLELAQELISEEGRAVTFAKLDGDATDPQKPWKGAGALVPTGMVTTFAVFLPDGTSGFLGGSGLGGLLTDIELFKGSEHVLLVAPPTTGEDLSTYHILADGPSIDGQRWRINSMKELKPADLTVLFAMGVSR